MKISLIRSSVIGIMAAAFLTVCFSVNPVNAVGEKSTGYRMGMLTRYQNSGYIIKSGEGELNMGNEGTPLIETYKNSNGDTEKNYINPWRFSQKEFNENYLEYIGSYVWIEYTRDVARIIPVVDTPYRAVNIEHVKKTTDMPQKYISEKLNYSKSNGVQIGRIVQISETGLMVKSYEVTVQCGNSGNQYKFMSVVEDDALYEYLVRALKEGRLMKIYYDTKGIERVVDFAHNTKYMIYGAEILNTSL